MPPVLNMAQYDANSRTIVATLWDGTSGFNVPSGAVVMVRFGKPDNTGGLYDHTEAGEAITYSGNVVTAPVATQMLSVSGKVQADIEIYQSGATEQASVKLATFCFTVNVEKAAYPDAEIISSDYYNIVAAQIAAAIEAGAIYQNLGLHRNKSLHHRQRLKKSREVSREMLNPHNRRRRRQQKKPMQPPHLPKMRHQVKLLRITQMQRRKLQKLMQKVQRLRQKMQK